ncbi:MAG TPA: DUF4124 domain-containing protein [Candidatus Methylomirabilis sp.]|nr:DUF4124 domain-containing protein [Candidatus Methylomirabilis sp.]
MTRFRTATMLPLLIGVGLLLAPTETRAQGFRGGTPGGGSADSGMPGGGSVSHPAPVPPPPAMIRPPLQPVPPPPLASPPGFPVPGQPGVPGPNQWSFRDRLPRQQTFIYSPGVVYGVPYAVPVPYDSGSSSYGSAPYYDPAASDPYGSYGGAPSLDLSAAGPDSPSSSPGVIQYPSGRYELRGDGWATPYQWVWIPNPPPGPPPSSAGARPAAPPPPPSAPPAARQATVYRWIDGEGVVHFTDSLESVPPEFRAKVKPAS